MLDRDKLILVCRLGVKDLDLTTYMEVSQRLASGFDESVKVLVLPDSERKPCHTTFQTVSEANYTAEEILKIMKESEKTIKSLTEKQ